MRGNERKLPRRRVAVVSSIIAAVTALVVAGPVPAKGSAARASQRTVVGIAVMLPTTGPSRFVGRSAMDAVKLAVWQSDASGVGPRFRVDAYDDWSWWADAPTIVFSNVVAGAAANPTDYALIEGLTNVGIAQRVVAAVNYLGLPTLFPAVANPGLSRERYGDCVNLRYSLLHPVGRPNNAFFLPPYDSGCSGTTAPTIGDRFGSWYALRSKHEDAAQTRFADAYRARYGTWPKTWADLYYDAAMVEISAANRLAAAGEPITRTSVRSEIQHLRYDDHGLLFGTVGFDRAGDNSGLSYNWAASSSNRTISLYYDAPISCPTVDRNGSDYRVSWSGHAGPAQVTASCAGTGIDGNGVVTLKLARGDRPPVGTGYRIRARDGTDRNTVRSLQSTTARRSERPGDFTSGVFGR